MPKVNDGKYVTVRQGESTESVAVRHGHFWQTLWDHEGNTALRELRKDPHTLFPGDRLFIPDIRQEQCDCESERHHVFRRKGIPSILRIALKRNSKPRANEPYRLTVDGATVDGKTNAQGKIEEKIDPLAYTAHLVVGEGERSTKHHLKLRHLDPVTEPSGVNARLHNLGCLLTYEGNKITSMTQTALTLFQQGQGMKADGRLTEETRQKLVEVHGC
jgi:hypothetical protein